MKKWLLGLFICMVFNMSASLGSAVKPQEALENPNLNTFVPNSNQVAFQLFNILSQNQKDFVFSPYGVTMSLGLAYAGAEASTQSQIARILRYQLNPKAVLETFESLYKALVTRSQAGSDDYSLNIAASIWVQRGRPFVPDFEKIVASQLKSTLKQEDFVLRPDQARVEINNWVRENAPGGSNEIIASGELSKDIKILVVSTAYMKGKWENAFDPNLTKQSPFFSDPFITSTVPTMTVVGDFPYINQPAYSVAELPFDLKKNKNALISMVIILPHDTYGITQVKNSLKADTLASLMAAMKPRTLLVSLPKFSIANHLSFDDSLKKLGLTDPFSSYADFSGIDGSPGLSLSKVLQKSFIGFDEKGVDAGLPTYVMSSKAGAKPPEIFNANHPFIFLIVEKISGLILFMGQVTEPK